VFSGMTDEDFVCAFLRQTACPVIPGLWPNQNPLDLPSASPQVSWTRVTGPRLLFKSERGNVSDSSRRVRRTRRYAASSAADA